MTGMTAASTNASVAVNLRGASFQTAVQWGAAEYDSLDVTIAAQPAPLGIPGASLDLFDLFTSRTTDYNFGTLSYMRGFLPARYNEMYVVNRRAAVARYVGSKGLYFYNWVYMTGPATSLPNPIAPTVGRISGARVNGANVMASGLVGVGVTPLLTWDTPVTGSADGYWVVVIELYDDGVSTSAKYRYVGSFFRTTRSLQFPSGFLASGKTYVARISAVREPKVVGGAAPFRYSATSAYATAWTYPFRTN
jgi:hypothetical protein